MYLKSCTLLHYASIFTIKKKYCKKSRAKLTHQFKRNKNGRNNCIVKLQRHVILNNSIYTLLSFRSIQIVIWNQLFANVSYIFSTSILGQRYIKHSKNKIQ